MQTQRGKKISLRFGGISLGVKNRALFVQVTLLQEGKEEVEVKGSSKTIEAKSRKVKKLA